MGQEEAMQTAPDGFRIDASGFTVDIRSDCAQTLALVDRYLLPWLPRVELSPDGGNLVFSFLTGDQEPGRFHVQMNGDVIASSEAMPYLFTLLQQGVDDATIRALNGLVAVHAGVVTYKDKAIVLPGPSGSGKSSLVQELLRRGAEYCSDEYALFDSQGRLHPYPRALLIRDAKGEQHPVLATEIHATVRQEPAPAGLLLFLQYESGKIFEVRPLSHSDALLRLLSNTPQILAEKPEIFALLKTAVVLARCFHGVRGDVTEAADKILHLAATAS
jgi:hypothetical protein